MGKHFLILGTILGALAVAIGAFGAHGLQAILLANGRVSTFETAVQYHMFHTLALLVIGVLLKEKTHQLLKFVGYSFFAGIMIFSGSLYTLSITNITILGAITPIGGIAFILGWILLLIYLIKNY